ncbi:MAG: hypothetical protein IAE64_02035 [Flavobacteriales bacterium]|nr:MAG: hypothetical protein F9K28_07305 [Bacteroidota bacterium]KXK34840.1 MAG: hypothetical protein UZ06_CHB003000877 [Chlorobi bacterium OLB6]MBE2265012.1 hypothetical protein [Flavobacteriales bacterium]MBW7854139.1 hypothetical protein [Candidatus Kapabacteria bacterium]MBZ0193678.1 hypothetical protein [Candidatus Kapabacteria bacterium]
MMDSKLTEQLQTVDLVDAEMVESAFRFWFSNHDHIRSPFPEYIHDELKQQSVKKLIAWCSAISDRARQEITDEILAEKFEELLFEQALGMVQTDDERLTILYPFMPRLGDVLQSSQSKSDNTQSTVIHREHIKKNDAGYLRIRLCNSITSQEWETEFELPE